MLVRYYAVVVCPSVCPSVRHKPVLYRNHWTNRAAFWQEDFFSPVPHCVIRNFEHLQKLRYFPLRTLSQTPDLQKFRHGKSIALSTKLVVVVVDGRACWRHLYDSRRVVAVYYKSLNCNPPTPLLQFVMDLLYKLFRQLTRFRLTWRVARSVCGSRASCV